MSSSTSDLSLFSSFEKEPAEPQTPLGQHTVASDPSAGATPRPGNDSLTGTGKVYVDLYSAYTLTMFWSEWEELSLSKSKYTFTNL